jgi:hypothetical protein
MGSLSEMLHLLWPSTVCGLLLSLAPVGTHADVREPAGVTATAPASGAAVRWQHPAGIITDDTIAEIKSKIATRDWAREVYAVRRRTLTTWLNVPYERLRSVFPRRRGNVYHDFSCPRDRSRLTFDPFTSDMFKCPSCGKSYRPDTDAGIYPPGDRYHGTMYDGWACLFYMEAGSAAADMGLVGRIEGPEGGRYTQRGIDILLLYADTIERLATKRDTDPQMSVLLTYHREGDNKVLNDLACAYELLRGRMTADQRRRFETVVLQRMLDDIMLEPIYRYNHNNLYQWHRTIVQTALVLERADLIDWSFGYGRFDPEHQPEHRSIRRLISTHFRPDGAYWEMCSGYHLYPLQTFCELAVLSRNLATMDPGRFPPRLYDLTAAESESGRVIRRALEWFMSMAMPDRTMPTIGDSMAPRAGMEDYYSTAEVGYRYFDLKSVGDYRRLRDGRRSWAALLYGAADIVQRPTPFTSSYLSSGWVSLRNEWNGNRVWVGLNGLVPGGGHQHADRLTLLSYSCGQLLSLEKGTPYNESVTRELGTLSQSHGTVTVDMTSAKQGESLTGDEVPKAAFFVTSPIVQYAELHADHLYPQTSMYRRSVALIEDIWLDLFRVRGGKIHDWMLQHAGPAPVISFPLADGRFEPAAWLANGTGRVRRASTAGTWDARWTVGGVTSRITMLGPADTEVYSLETYPIDNAVVTPEHPPCQTLCVRRHDDAPFLAVHEAWRDRPNLQAVDRPAGAEAVAIKTAANTYHVLCGPGQASFNDGVSIRSDAAFALLRNRDAVVCVGGTVFEAQTPEGTLTVRCNPRVSLSAEWSAGTVTFEVSQDVQYETCGGRDLYRPAPDTVASFDGTLWKIDVQRRRVRDRSD